MIHLAFGHRREAGAAQPLLARQRHVDARVAQRLGGGLVARHDDDAARARELHLEMTGSGRHRGWATGKDELIQGAVAVAGPFFNGAKRVAGSICIFGPSVRLPAAQVEKVGRLLASKAGELSKVLGHAPRRG